MQEVKKHLLTCPSLPHWEMIGIHPHHGIALGLFSLHSKKSAGIGEFTDLYPLIDWCSLIGFDTIQLLPLNETSSDNSPYNALSSCALDPMYIGLAALPYVEDEEILQKDLANLRELFRYPFVRYDKLKKRKKDFLLHYYRLFFTKIKNTLSYNDFVSHNPWLYDYALFRVLKEQHNDLPWQRWEKKYQHLSAAAFVKLTDKNQDSIDFYIFLQYLCFSQLTKVKDYATQKNIFLKGDIPILINADSVDVWKDSSFFDLSHVAGCPPDDFNRDGQKWGFPLFNWEKQKQEGYSWWKRRLTVASSCYHMYRIDHAVGFFRIWSMLPHEDPKQGKFLPKKTKKWEQQGRDLLLMMLDATSMLPIAEDLGLIPKMTYRVLKELGICGVKIFRQQQNFFKQFIPLNKYEPLSVTTLATHDLPVLQEWWIKDKRQAKKMTRFLNMAYAARISSGERLRILTASHQTSSIFHISLFQEYLALISDFVRLDSQEERINMPGKCLAKNWTYRFLPSLEEITNNEKLYEAMKKIAQKI